MAKHVEKIDFNLICVKANSFPDGILEAFKTLERVVPNAMERDFYGISHGSENGIVYWAAAKENYAGEAKALNLEQFTVKQGTYASETINNPMEHPEKIGETFTRLLQHPNLDPKGACIEWYKTLHEVVCMVRLVE